MHMSGGLRPRGETMQVSKGGAGEEKLGEEKGEVPLLGNGGGLT